MMDIEIAQETNKAISVMHNVSMWMEKSRMHLSEWWQPQNMNRNFLLQHTEPDEFYVALVNGKPAASVILQDSERNQSWRSVDGDTPQKALYVHWLCVARDFAGKGYSKEMINFAAGEAKKRGFRLLRLDTDADGEKLCKLYEGLGFKLMGVKQGENHKTAFYQKNLIK
jgi:ribosomal protein S18 acetylase RimI-like enzyme